MTVNKLYPGEPDYKGPTSGYFTLLHHEGPLVEWSHDVMGRVKHIQIEKAVSERPIRLRHIVYVPVKMIPKKWQKASAELQKASAELQKASAELQKADAEWQKARAEWRKTCAELQKARAEWRKADAELQKASAELQKTCAEKLLAYLHKHVKDCRWNGKELVFT